MIEREETWACRDVGYGEKIQILKPHAEPALSFAEGFQTSRWEEEK
jgi:hypothetical protein